MGKLSNIDNLDILKKTVYLLAGILELGIVTYLIYTTILELITGNFTQDLRTITLLYMLSQIVIFCLMWGKDPTV